MGNRHVNVSHDPEVLLKMNEPNPAWETKEKNAACRLLIADDESDLRFLVGSIYGDLGWDVDEAADGPEALAKLEQFHYDLVLLDHRMPGLNGGQVYDALCARGILVPVVLITAAARGEEIAAQHGITKFLGKPFGIDDLLEITEATKRHC
jgi:CheY-like chemotaxis protein